MTHKDAVRTLFGTACLAGSLLALKLDGRRRHRQAAARSLHPSVWGRTENTPRDSVLCAFESRLVRDRMSGRIDRATYQHGMSELAFNRATTELV